METVLDNYRSYLAQVQTKAEVLALLRETKLVTVSWFNKHGYSDRGAAKLLNISNNAISKWRKQSLEVSKK